MRDYCRVRETIRGDRSVPGGKESEQCWRDFLRDITRRGLRRGKADARHAYLGAGEMEQESFSWLKCQQLELLRQGLGVEPLADEKI